MESLKRETEHLAKVVHNRVITRGESFVMRTSDIIEKTDSAVSGTAGALTEFKWGNADGKLYLCTSTGEAGAASWVVVAISTDLPEDVQDIVGAMFNDSNTINFTYTDGADQISADVKVTSSSSVELASTGIQLVNDESTPGAYKIYGTGPLGTKGWQTHINDHGYLLGLADDDHSHYVKRTEFTSGSLLFRGAANIAEDNSNLFWDDSNEYLGIGTAIPSARFHVYDGNIATTSVSITGEIVLLMHLDGSHNGTMFTDSSSYAHAITRIGTVVVTSSTKYKFSPTSGYNTGAGNSYLSLNSDDFNLGTGAFTIDFWLNVGGASNGEWIVLASKDLTNSGCFKIHTGTYVGSKEGNIVVGYYGHMSIADDPLISSTKIHDSDWHHIAVTRDSTNTMRLFIDGTTEDTHVFSGSINLNLGSNMFIFGGSAHEELNGYIDELRIIKGRAVWTTANFNPDDIIDPYVDSIPTTGKLGINNNSPNKKIEINTGSFKDGMRISYNKPSEGEAGIYTDILVDSAGNLKINATGGTVDFHDENIVTTGTVGGIIDHGGLTGLLDDDHTQYLKESDLESTVEGTTLNMTASFFPRQVTDAGPMTATNGTEGEIVYNLADDNFWGCYTTGTPGDWKALSS